MVVVRTILGALLGAIINLAVYNLLPFNPDLSDWGGRAFPVTYLFPLVIVAIVSYVSGWIAAKISPDTGRLCGMFGSIITAVAVIGWRLGGGVLSPLFDHPAYPLFSDQALLALAILLVAGHLGGARVEKSSHAPDAEDLNTSNQT